MASRSTAPGAAVIETSQVQALPATSEKLADALAMLEAHRRDALLETVAVTAKELLRSSDLKISLPKVAERLGSAIAVDRTHIFLVDPHSPSGRILQHYQWTAPLLSTPPELDDPTQRPMSEVGLGLWVERLRRGGIIASHVRDLNPDARAVLEVGGVKSLLSVPVFADDRWLGIIGFD
jgi:GAF domain-containing protein